MNELDMVFWTGLAKSWRMQKAPKVIKEWNLSYDLSNLKSLKQEIDDEVYDDSIDEDLDLL